MISNFLHNHHFCALRAHTMMIMMMNMMNMMVAPQMFINPQNNYNSMYISRSSPPSMRSERMCDLETSARRIIKLEIRHSMLGHRRVFISLGMPRYAIIEWRISYFTILA